MVVALPIDEREGPGARPQGVEPEVGPALGDGGRREDHPRAVDELRQQGGVRFLQVEDHGRRVLDLHRLHAGELALAWRAGRVQDPVDVELHRIAIEVGAVMEFDALAERELQGGRIAVLPGGGQPRLDLQRGVNGDQGVVHVVVNLAFDSLRRFERVERPQLRLERNLEGAAGLRRPGAVGRSPTAAGTSRQEKGRDHPKSQTLHEHVLPSLCRDRPFPLPNRA